MSQRFLLTIVFIISQFNGSALFAAEENVAAFDEQSEIDLFSLS